MSIAEWSLLIGTILPFVLATIPWMMRVHAKLAVIVSQIESLCEKLEMESAENRGIRKESARHGTRIESHEVQIAYLEQRLENLE